MTLTHLPWRAIIFGSLVGLAAALADVYDFSGFLVNNELKAINGQFALRGPRTPTAPVVIITIDEDSFAELNMPWPWPRALHGKLIDIVTRGKPIAIAELYAVIAQCAGAEAHAEPAQSSHVA